MEPKTTNPPEKYPMEITIGTRGNKNGTRADGTEKHLTRNCAKMIGAPTLRIILLVVVVTIHWGNIRRLDPNKRRWRKSNEKR